MSLRVIVSALGGDLYQNGARANVPAPGHGAADRSVSLVMSEDRVVVHSFGGADWREVLDDLRRRGLIDRSARPTGARGGSAPPRPDHRVRREAARALWSAGVQTGPRGLLARHLRSRGVIWTPAPVDLQEHPAAPLSVYRKRQPTRRAMMARVSDVHDATVAVELTYLDLGGRQAIDLRVSRKTVGQVPAGSAVRLSPVAPAMVVAEGVVTTLSAMAWFERPGWALLSAENLARWQAPAGVRHVIIAADRGDAGEAAAHALRDRLWTDGLVSEVILPRVPWRDWNEALSAAPDQRREEGRGGAPGKRGWTPLPAGD